MAQAARLNLRMQRELKLLLSDPPPGAAFPSLSSLSSPSLSSIDAKIEGPEGTVYANGIFKLKIQIPDRYPFQPPVVTFVTPIYHPNIDNGGRICLDILNLPPKGAWQPSLNISTVLTSIGLLLSEPNPDDGLMHDASEEYKYNRQAFYQKARSMTEKFASAQATEDVGSVSLQEIQIRMNPDAEKVDDKGPDASKSNAIQSFVSKNRLCGVSRKLSLDSSGSKQQRVYLSDNQLEVGELKQTDTSKGVNKIPAHYLFDNQIEAGGSKQNRDTTNSAKEKNKIPFDHPSNNQIEAGGLKHNRHTPSEFNTMPAHYLPDNKIGGECLNKVAVGISGECKKLWGTKRSISQEFSVSSDTRNSNEKDDLMPDQCASHLEGQSSSMDPLARDSCNAKIHANLSSTEMGRGSIDISLKRKQSLEYHDSEQKSGKQLHTIPHPYVPQKFPSSASRHSLPLPEASGNGQMDTVDRTLNKFTTTKHKKPGLAGRKMSLGSFSSSQSLQNNKENLVSLDSFSDSKANFLSKPPLLSAMSEPGDFDEHAGKSSANFVHKLDGKLHRQPLKSVIPFQESNNQHFQLDQKQVKQDNEEKFETNNMEHEVESPISAAVIVLDSEDSEDERNMPTRFKLSLARKCLPRKQKAKA